MVKGYENGNFLGPTVLDNVQPGNPGYDEEIFGPVRGAVGEQRRRCMGWGSMVGGHGAGMSTDGERWLRPTGWGALVCLCVTPIPRMCF